MGRLIKEQSFAAFLGDLVHRRDLSICVIATACIRMILDKAVFPCENTCDVWLARAEAYLLRERMALLHEKSRGMISALGSDGVPLENELDISCNTKWSIGEEEKVNEEEEEKEEEEEEGIINNNLGKVGIEVLIAINTI